MRAKLVACGDEVEALSIRGGLARTFGSLAGFLALLLVGGGSYLIEDGWAHPLRAEDAAMIGGACSIALGTTVFGYLLKSCKKRRAQEGIRSPQRESRDQTERESDYCRAAPESRLAFQRIYTDKQWIHPAKDRHM